MRRRASSRGIISICIRSTVWKCLSLMSRLSAWFMLDMERDSEKRLSQLVSNPKIRLFRQSDLVTHINPCYFRVTYANLIGGVYLGSVVVAVLSLFF